MGSCMWFAIGNDGFTDTEDRWVHAETSHMQSNTYFDASMLYQYITSAHWAAAQITLGANDIACTNSYERVFNILGLLIGLCLGCTLVSSLSASMINVHLMR